MASFPQTLPHVTTSLDATIDSWLTQEGGSHAAENALEMVFSKDLNIASQLGNTGQSRWNHAGSEQLAGHLGAGSSNSAHSSGAFSTSLPIGYSTPSGINGASDTGISKLYPFGLQFEDIWKSTPPSNHYAFDTIQHNDNNARDTALGPSSDSLHQHNQGAEALSKSARAAHARQSLYHGSDSQSNGGHQDQGQTTFSSLPLSGVDTQESYNSESAPLSSVPKRRVIHRGLTTDTWLNSMKMPEEGVAAAPRPDITSPEQVIGELSVETTMVIVSLKKQMRYTINHTFIARTAVSKNKQQFHP